MLQYKAIVVSIVVMVILQLVTVVILAQPYLRGQQSQAAGSAQGSAQPRDRRALEECMAAGGYQTPVRDSNGTIIGYFCSGT
jgi:hypothetical protein